MPVQLFANNAFSTLAAPLASDGLTATLATGTGSRFPSPTGGDWFIATLVGVDANGAENTWEIVKVTARSGDSLTIVRAQESTSTAAWAAGTRIELRLTAGGVAGKEDAISSGTTAQYLRGDKSWRDFFTDVRAATLTGLSTATNAVVAATDTVLAALGKLQAQVSAKQDTLVSGTSIKTVNSTSLLGSGNITTGDVTGQASSVDGEVALFSGTGGKTIKRATGSGLAKLTNGVLSAAVAGTDYQTAQSVTGLVKSSGTTRSAAVAGTDYQAPIGTISGIAKGNGANALTAATAGTDYVAPGTATNFTKPQRPSLSTETAPSANAITWDLTTDQILRINLNANITTFNMTGTLSSLAGNQYQVIVRYNGGSSITWNANIKWPAGTAPTLTGTSGKVDTFTFVVSSTDGTNFYLINTGKTQNV